MTYLLGIYYQRISSTEATTEAKVGTSYGPSRFKMSLTLLSFSQAFSRLSNILSLQPSYHGARESNFASFYLGALNLI